MKVGILTFHFAYNYGAALQAYALRKAIEDLGHEAWMIDYRSPGLPGERRPPRGLRSGYFFHLLMLKRHFDQFRRTHMKLTREVETFEALSDLAGSFDALVTGSDQVWNMNLVQSFDPAYFLGFGQDVRARRISYAACFGRVDQPAVLLPRAGPLLREITHRSVRNQMSHDVLRDTYGLNSEVVLDPTQLIDWRPLAVPTGPARGAYVAAFLLAAPNRAKVERIANRAARRWGCPVVTLPFLGWEAQGQRRVSGAGPIEWLRVLGGARLVVSDSYHANLLATEMEVPPLACYTDWQGRRMIEAFARSGLENRISEEPTEAWVDEQLEKTIDWPGVQARLTPCKNASLAFLRASLG